MSTAEERQDVIAGLARAADSIKPEPGMDGPHGGYLGGVTRERACLAIERAIEYLAAATPSPDRETAGQAGGLDVRRALAREARALIETADNRALAADGPVSHVRDELTDSEWRRLYLIVARLAEGEDAK